MFASEHAKGKRPLWPATLLRKRIQPLAIRAGSPKIGWHSLRHSVSAWSKEAGFSLEEVKTLLRHENIALSENYGRVELEAKRGLPRRLLEFVKQRVADEGSKPEPDLAIGGALASNRIQERSWFLI